MSDPWRSRRSRCLRVRLVARIGARTLRIGGGLLLLLHAHPDGWPAGL